MREAVLLALSFTQGRQTQEVVIIGDGAYSDLADLDLQRSAIRHIRVTGGEGNVGITRLAFRKRFDAAQSYETLISVKNFSSQPRQVPLQLTLRRRLLLERQFTLAPGQEEVVVARLEGPLRGVAQAELLLDDALGLDNRAYGVLSEKTQTWILLVGDGNYFLEQLLTSLPGVHVNVAPEVSQEALPQLLEANHLLIFIGVAPPRLQRGNYLLINTVPPDERFHVQGTVREPQVLDWERQHALLEFVDLTGLRIEEALALQPRGEARSLVDAEGTSLVSVVEQPSLRIVTLGFDLMRSDLPLRVAFPVLINNLLRWINPDVSDVATGQIRAGTPYPIFFETPVARVDVQGPQGKERTYEIEGNPWVFTDANEVGVYILRYGEDKRYLAVNLLDENESDINPVDALASFEPTVEAGGALQPAGVVETPLWPYLLLGAVAVVLGEWYVWCRD
jgi:hypothetical protein